MTELQFFNKLKKLQMEKVIYSPLDDYELTLAIREKNTQRCPLCAVAAAEGYEVGELDFMEAATYLKVDESLAREIAIAADYDKEEGFKKYFGELNPNNIVKIRRKLEKLIKEKRVENE